MNEIAQPIMSERDARKITERIRIVAHNYTEAKANLIELVQEAKDGSAHEALGYPSWTAYLAETLGDEPMRLARDERQEMVKVLSAEGMSTRAIAPIVGAKSHDTIARDLRETGVRNRTPESKSDAELLTGAEWVPAPESCDSYKDWADRIKRSVNVREGRDANDDDPMIEDKGIKCATGTITGMDGKTYTRPEPKEQPKPKAEAITSQFSSAIVDLNRVLDRFHRISTNDNFQRNKSKIEALHGNDLARAISELQNLADQLN
ncbi:hypothetical protein [Yaniella sp.]|uniref:hypothetical protein n=1 Tax=Yaniella sp. TaxID=2773929 RepID=UPI00264A47EE|nr:hypothetical protein [Yaniella sp.]MDN6358433.1 hypothetical protein [Yaniella sp.]